MFANPLRYPGPWSRLCLAGMNRMRRSSCVSLLCKARECATVASDVSGALVLLHGGRRVLCAGQDVSLTEQRTVLLCRSLGRDSLHTRQMVPHSLAATRGWGVGGPRGASRVLGVRSSPGALQAALHPCPALSSLPTSPRWGAPRAATLIAAQHGPQPPAGLGGCGQVLLAKPGWQKER